MGNRVVDAQPHRLAHLLLGEVEAERAEHVDLGFAPEGLRVDQQAVEIEDDRGDRSVDLGRRGGQLSAQSSFRTTSTMASPASVGFSATVAPAAPSASILAWAVPFEPEMIAPAWPILRPGGAVTPAM